MLLGYSVSPLSFHSLPQCGSRLISNSRTWAETCHEICSLPTLTFKLMNIDLCVEMSGRPLFWCALLWQMRVIRCNALKCTTRSTRPRLASVRTVSQASPWLFLAFPLCCNMRSRARFYCKNEVWASSNIRLPGPAPLQFLCYTFALFKPWMGIFPVPWYSPSKCVTASQSQKPSIGYLKKTD